MSQNMPLIHRCLCASPPHHGPDAAEHPDAAGHQRNYYLQNKTITINHFLTSCLFMLSKNISTWNWKLFLCWSDYYVLQYESFFFIFLDEHNHLLQPTSCIDLQIKILRKLQQISDLLWLHWILRERYIEREGEKSFGLHPDSRGLPWTIWLEYTHVVLYPKSQSILQWNKIVYICLLFFWCITHQRESLTLANNRGKATANVSVIFVRSSSWVFFSLAVRTCAKTNKQKKKAEWVYNDSK